MAVASNFPAIRPSLNLDFANAKSLDPRITFSRASAATYYDGKTVAKAEENLLLRSQEFDQAPWEKLLTGAALAPVVTANAGTAPDGTVTADRVVFSLNGGVSSGDISQLVQTLTLSGQYVFSVWLRSADGSSTYNMQLAGAGAVADVAVNGSWQRFTVTGTYAGAYSNQLRLRGAQGIVNSNTADVLVWGAQLEQRSQVTAYTPTTTQPITNYIPVLQTAPAGVPRFDHNPVTGESLGLLVEEQRTNLLTYSEQFDNATHWRLSNVSVIANLSVDPSGSLGGDYVRESLDAVAATHEIARQSSVEFTSGVAYTYSVFAKAGPNSRLLRMSFPSAAFAGEPTVYFNLVAGTTSGVSGASIASAGNGWWKCSFTQVATATTGSIYLGLGIAAASGAKNYTGDGYSGIYIWGAQLEAGTFPTSYIKTEASQVTRAADPNLTAALGQPGAGTIYVDATVRSGNTLATSGATTFAATASTRQKTAVAYDAASTRKSINGAAVTSSAGTQGGSNISIAPGATGWISKLSIYPQKFGDAHLQSLTA